MRATSIVTASAALIVAAGATLPACSRDTQAMTPEAVEQQYGVAGAFNGSVSTPEGSVKGTVVPVTLPDGRKAQLVIPAQASKDPHSVYMQDDAGLHPVHVS